MYSFYDAEEEKYVTTAGEAGDVYDVYIGWYYIDKDVIAYPAVATNLKVTVVEKGAAATFDRYEFDVTSPAIAGETYVWTLYEVNSKNEKTAVATSTDWASTSSKNFVVASYDDGNADTKDDEFKSMPATNTLFDQTVTIYSKAYSNRGPIELKFPAGENYITAMPAKTDVAFAADVTQDAVKAAALSAEDLAIKITKQTNDSEDGETQQYLESGYSIIKQECDGTKWNGLVSVTINTKDTVGGVDKIVEKSTILEVELAVNTAKNN